MLRKRACSTGRSSAVLAVALVGGCRWLTIQHRCAMWPRTPPTPTRPAALFVPRRTAATSAQEGTACGRGLSDADIIGAADWKSPQYEVRLGFRGSGPIGEERLKRHYYVLAKHFHPDASAAGSGGSSTSGEAFQSVKEAYDAISASIKAGGTGRSYTPGGGPQDFAGGFTYSDEARRRSQVRLLGDAVALFIVMTVLLIFVVSRHNKTRMQSRYLWHLVWIFFMIQLFPRLLAAAIIFAAHSSYLVDSATLKEQAAISLVVERRPSECTVKLDGIRAASVPHVVVQVTTTASETATELVSSTLTFDKGVTEFLLPAPASPSSVYHIKAVDEERKMVLVDRTISAAV